MTPSALVQRFGSKRELLAAVVGRWADGLSADLDAIRRRHTSPLAALEHYGDCMAAMGSAPAALANHLAYLHRDLTDPELAGPMRAAAASTRAAIEGWLEEAVALGELKPATDPRSLARLTDATIGGSLLTWALHQDGTAASSVRMNLQQLLAPYRAA